MKDEINNSELYDLIAARIYENSEPFAGEEIIEEEHDNSNCESFIFYKSVIAAIKNNSLSNLIEYHNRKVSALEHCWENMKRLRIEAYLQPNGYTTLTSLQKNNLTYENLIKRFYDKIKVSSMFMSEFEFIQQEKERIKALFIKPLVTTVSGDFKMGKGFNFTRYKEYAYDWLSQGEDFPLDKILFNALTEFENYVDGKHSYNDKAVLAPLAIHSIVSHLSDGVAYLLYGKFLKNQLALKQNDEKMAKNFDIEQRDAFGKPYLKVFLKNNSDFPSIANLLGDLSSVKTANVTQQQSGKTDITIYPEKAYDIKEVYEEIELALENYFNGNPVDPIFITETLSQISEKAYFQIIDYIILLGKNLESFKSLNEKFDEERYRDYFIPFLNSISRQHAAKGEVFNRKGKTDILIFDDQGNNIFIAECKLWKGKAYLLEAVEQLLKNYVNWRDEKTAIIIFNRDVKRFSEVITSATECISNHRYCVKDAGKRKETSYSYLFRNPDDTNKTIKLELILFNFS